MKGNIGYTPLELEIVSVTADIVTTSGAIELPVIPASINESGLYDL